MHTNIQPMHIGQVIRAIREARKATLEEIAFAANTNASNLFRIERGRQGYSPEALERIARALGVTVAELHVQAETVIGAGAKSASGDLNQRGASALTAKYAALSPENRSLADEFIALLLRRQRTSK
ncbi:helix-turn-helix transcriptional regulator [Halothiobacillus sp.]|uniref:helix-turn-helix domain-containing protein n=1 Tax=Halothiobacillus sp. TaxID=1891311 RepID=UPI002605BB47|nr:helix-turn-helix transcriptional regulator [Halothiobacillus sp.]MDD4967736.1 helix-turn-helix transcriptional regulator [Halothiobacillus sp.]